MKTEINMAYKKSTPGTHVYESSHSESSVKTVYVKRRGWPIPAPEAIKLTIEVIDE